MDLSLVYFPSAVLLGGLHALEPGHAKTLTAAYLIGTKGTKRDATILGLSVAFTHSIVVLGLSVGAVLLGREAFTDEAGYLLAVGSSVIVIGLGAWLLSKRLRSLRRANQAIGAHRHKSGSLMVNIDPAPPLQFLAEEIQSAEGAEFSISPHRPGSHGLHSHGGKLHGHHHVHDHDHDEHDHALMSDEEHARAHAATLPEYVQRGERPSVRQIVTFGAAGGLVPCPAAVSVMLLSLSLGESGKGLLMVLGFSLGLAITLVGVGLIVVTGISKLAGTGRFSRFSALAPSIAAGMVIFSGTVGLITALVKHSG